MNISKYFWDLKTTALAQTKRILQNPRHPRFATAMVTLLSRCDNPKEVFSVISRKEFIKSWPKIRSAWVKRERRSDFRDWWETMYEQLLEKYRGKAARVKGKMPKTFQAIGRVMKEARIKKGLSQRQLALSLGMKQPDISRIEDGKKNITLFTLIRICKILGMKKIVVG